MKSTHLELSLSEATSTSCGRSLALPVSLRNCTRRTILLALAFEISHWNFLSLVFVSVFKLPTTGWLRGTSPRSSSLRARLTMTRASAHAIVKLRWMLKALSAAERGENIDKLKR